VFPRSLGLALCAALTSSYAHATDCLGTTTLGGCFSSLGVSGPAEASPFRTLSLGRVLPPGSVAISANTWFVSKPAQLAISSPDPLGRSIDVVSRAGVLDWRGALGLGHRMDLTLALPIYVTVQGAGSDAIATQKPTALSGGAIGDPRLGVRANLWTGPTLRLMIRNEWTLPLGSEAHYAGDTAATSTLALTGVWDQEGWVAAVDIGYRASRAVRFGDVRLGTSAIVAMGLSRDILPEHVLTVGIEAWANPVLVASPKSDVPNSSGNTVVPSEWLLNVQLRPENLPAWFWLAGGSALPISHRDTANVPFADSSFIAPSAARVRLGLGAGFLLGGP